MLTNKYMNANYFLNGFATGSRTHTRSFGGIYYGNSPCNSISSWADRTVIAPNDSDYANLIEFYTTQPINIDRLNTVSTPGTSTSVATDLVADVEYTIVSDGASDFTLIGSVDNITGTVFTATGAGTGPGDVTEEHNITELINTVEYTILVSGDSDFTLIGSADNNTGTTFTATGPGTGTGTVTESLLITELVNLTEYTIVSDGATDFTLIGATNNNVGTTFTATGAGTGVGVATELDNGSELLISFNLSCKSTGLGNAKTAMPILVFDSIDDNKSPTKNGTCEWFLLKKNNQVLTMGQVSDLTGTGDIKLSNSYMVTSDIYRFYSLTFGIDGTRTITTDANEILVTV